MDNKRVTEMKGGEFLSIKELSVKTNLTVPFLRKAMTKYGLPFHKLGSLVRFLEADFNKWAAERRHEAS